MIEISLPVKVKAWCTCSLLDLKTEEFQCNSGGEAAHIFAIIVIKISREIRLTAIFRLYCLHIGHPHSPLQDTHYACPVLYPSFPS
ncbi:hypothetical protein GRI43_12975 [Altererythrobacter luteolus]|uniref:Uncharacterized protein n=1 Tax=Pontixanthobacter luteolus TaxID=295089 RepID=A0A6I4V915_9SPHN|nr:hypothetical protein [Pontixanthobacter luteolus]MXP48302.1 hypothetical protein [Pontixanthobacter luteolus]